MYGLAKSERGHVPSMPRTILPPKQKGQPMSKKSISDRLDRLRAEMEDMRQLALSHRHSPPPPSAALPFGHKCVRSICGLCEFSSTRAFERAVDCLGKRSKELSDELEAAKIREAMLHTNLGVANEDLEGARQKVADLKRGMKHEQDRLTRARCINADQCFGYATKSG